MSKSGSPLVNTAQAGELSGLILYDVALNKYEIKPVEGQNLSVYKNNVNIGFGSLQKITVKTGTTYSVVAADLGTIFTNRGAGGNIAYTLPATSTIAVGWHATFYAVAAGTVTVASAVGDTIVAFNDATADSIAFSTSSEIIGGSVRMVWDGTGWLSFVSLGTETQTPVIAT